MGVSRAGYYKWKNKESTPRDYKRKRIIEYVKEVHNNYPTHGYRWVCAYINRNYKEDCSESLVYKIFRYLGYKAETKHRAKDRKYIKTDRYPNLIFTTWDTVDSPRQVIVSDMTSLWIGTTYYEMTLYFDVFTKEILSWNLSDCRGDRNPYIEGLKEVVEVLDGWNSEEPTIIHTDQGSVYSSKAYNDIIKDKNIERSMSRAGKPTDNPVNESLNGWIKEELEVEFRLYKGKDRKEIIANYIKFYNEKRPSFSLNYDTPKDFYNKYVNGITLRKETFKNRILTTEPKFVQERRRKSKEMKALKEADECLLS